MGYLLEKNFADTVCQPVTLYFNETERSVGTKKTGKGRRKIGRKKRRNRARIRHRK